MIRILILAGALLAVTLLRNVLPFLIARLFGRAIGSHALAQQPDEIHLEKSGPNAWKDPNAVRPLASPLLERGFRDAGIYQMKELPGLTLQLMVKSDESMLGVVYEHPKAGHWVEVACRYQDGGSVTYSTSRPTGLTARPQHPVINLPELDAGALYERARAERPDRPLDSVSAFTVVRMFERAYAESIAYRKQTGISAREVGEVAKMRKAA
jgi:hypothetical protein